ncbi:MAG: 3-dehydroquinate dehydratase [Alicyclobacillus sp.]|nr:3-dehydroquinate dehydratase [Alicyclobacillus sp.]
MPGYVLLLNGPSLNRLGERDPAVYGTETLAEIVERVRRLLAPHDIDLVDKQSNHEGVLMDILQQYGPTARGIIINPGAFAHYSYALRDCLEDVGARRPVIEVHLSNVYRREPFRHHSVLAPVVTGQITGLGSRGYELAAQAVISLIQEGTA